MGSSIPVTLVENLSSLWLSRLLCDVKLVGKDYNGTTTPVFAHSVILAANSKVLGMFFKEQWKQGEKDADHMIKIPDLCTEDILVAVEFLYNRMPSCATQLEALKRSAHLLEIELAQKYCNLQQTVTIDHVTLQDSKATKCSTKGQALTNQNCTATTYCCSICSLTISSEKEFQLHLTRQHAADLSLSISSDRSAKEHKHIDNNRQTVTIEKQSKCNVDLISSTREYAKEYKCVSCNKHFKSHKWYKRHIQQHSGGNNVFKCCYCNNTCSSVVSLVDHIHNSHSQKRYFMCAICAKIHISQKRLVTHYCLYHQITATYTQLRASHCVITNLTQQLYFDQCKQHYVDDTDIIVSKFPCTLCNTVHLSQLQYLNDVQQHISNCSADAILNEYECHCCGEMFQTSAECQKHWRLEHDYTFQCKVCKLLCASVAQLKTHMEIHQNVKRFKCDECMSRFRTKFSLKTHQRIHANKFCYTCEFCGNNFRFKQGLQRHINSVHSPDFVRPFGCKDCSYRTFSRERLKNHERQHTKDQPYKCQNCTLEFKAKSILLKHVRKKHSEMTQTVFNNGTDVMHVL